MPAMRRRLRHAFLLLLTVTWLSGGFAWASDFDALACPPGACLDLPDPIAQNPLFDHHTDHCEHGMAHWVGLPAAEAGLPPMARPVPLALAAHRHPTPHLPREPRPPRA